MPLLQPPSPPSGERGERGFVRRPQSAPQGVPSQAAEKLPSLTLPLAAFSPASEGRGARSAHVHETPLAASEAKPSPLEAFENRLLALEELVQEQAGVVGGLRAENRELKRSVLQLELQAVRAHSKPLSAQSDPQSCPDANLQTVVRLEGFERLIAHCVAPCTGNRRFAGKVAWGKLQKTCRDLRYTRVPMELDPSIRIVPDNFPTIRRAVQNIDKNDAHDRARVVVRPKAEAYVEQITLDRRVTLLADPSSAESPVIHGRICIGAGAAGSIVRGFAVQNNNPRDPWGSAMDVASAHDVLIEECNLSSTANDEPVLNVHGGCKVTLRRNTINGWETQGVIGVSVDGQTTASMLENTIVDNSVGIRLQPSVKVTMKGNTIARNQKAIQLNEEGLESLVEGGFGRITLKNNVYTENRDGLDDATFSKSLEILLHPLLRRMSLKSDQGGSTTEDESPSMGAASRCGGLHRLASTSGG